MAICAKQIVIFAKKFAIFAKKIAMFATQIVIFAKKNAIFGKKQCQDDHGHAPKVPMGGAGAQPPASPAEARTKSKRRKRKRLLFNPCPPQYHFGSESRRQGPAKQYISVAWAQRDGPKQHIWAPK